MTAFSNEGQGTCSLDGVRAVLKAAEAIPFNDYVIGRGKRKPNGGIEIAEDSAVSLALGETFIRGYAEVEMFDSAAQQFLCAPFLPIMIEVGDACYVDDTSKQSNKMNEYLHGFSVKSLLLVGLESSRGPCWMTLYRRQHPSKPFTAEEAGIASYRIRAALFEWQLASEDPVLAPPASERYKLLPLGRRCLDVAVRRMRWIPRKRIASDLGITDDAVDAQIKRLAQLKLSNHKLMERFFGKLPPPRSLAPDDPEARS